jgi:hypothetical protein
MTVLLASQQKTYLSEKEIQLKGLFGTFEFKVKRRTVSKSKTMGSSCLAATTIAPFPCICAIFIHMTSPFNCNKEF